MHNINAPLNNTYFVFKQITVRAERPSCTRIQVPIWKKHIGLTFFRTYEDVVNLTF